MDKDIEKKSKEFTYTVNPEFDYIIEETNNTTIAVRKISWNGRPEKLDIRKYMYSNGEERMRKGISLTDDGADELTHVLVDNGYGNTKKIIKGIRNRMDYQKALDTIDIDEDLEDDGSEDYYDPSELLG